MFNRYPLDPFLRSDSSTWKRKLESLSARQLQELQRDLLTADKTLKSLAWHLHSHESKAP